MNRKSALLLTPLVLLQPATSHAQSAAAQKDAASTPESSLMVIKQRSGLSELDTPAAVSVVSGQQLRNSATARRR